MPCQRKRIFHAQSAPRNSEPKRNWTATITKFTISKAAHSSRRRSHRKSEPPKLWLARYRLVFHAWEAVSLRTLISPAAHI